LAVALVCFFFSSPASTISQNKVTFLTGRNKAFSLLLPPYVFNTKLKETMEKVFPLALLQLKCSPIELEE
jgi:hypothetical protein